LTISHSGAGVADATLEDLPGQGVRQHPLADDLRREPCAEEGVLDPTEIVVFLFVDFGLEVRGGRRNGVVVGRAELLVRGQTVLRNHRVRRERRSEDLLRELPKAFRGFDPGAEGRRGSDRSDSPRRATEARVKSAQQARDVRSLRAVVGVQLVEYDVAQRAPRSPQPR
jgi:hypothetical protein